VIIDTDVLIWFFRGNEEAKTFIESVAPFSVSAVTVMELMQGAKDKVEQRTIHKQLRAWGVEVVHLNEAISIRAVQFTSDFALSHSLVAMDALIAGTAVEYGGELITGNIKHFDCVPGLILKRFSC
jgi:predicted nucleic acid-binding protein